MKKFRDMAISLGFALLLTAAGLLTLLRRDDSVLYYENRDRTEFPARSAAAFADGAFVSELEPWLADRFPLRTTLLSAQTELELRLGRPVVNGVVVTEELLLPYKDYERWELDYIRKYTGLTADRQAALAEAAAEYGGTAVYMSLPEQFSYFSDRYPAYMENRQWYSVPVETTFRGVMEERGLLFLEMGRVFDALGRPEEYYYHSDHHFTFEGALVCYHSLMDFLREHTGLELRELREGENLLLRESGNRFLGSYGRKLYGRWESGDRFVWGEITETVPFTREDNGVPSEPFLLRLPEYDWEDVAYTAYMGGDMAETVLRTERPELPSLLIIGESYTNALETLLWWSFDETRSLDLRHYTEMTAEEYVRLYRPDIVLVIRDDTAYITE